MSENIRKYHAKRRHRSCHQMKNTRVVRISSKRQPPSTKEQSKPEDKAKSRVIEIFLRIIYVFCAVLILFWVIEFALALCLAVYLKIYDRLLWFGLGLGIAVLVWLIFQSVSKYISRLFDSPMILIAVCNAILLMLDIAAHIKDWIQPLLDWMIQQVTL